MQACSHPYQNLLSERLRQLVPSVVGSFDGDLFRFVDPRFTKDVDIISGKGALHASGRWHFKGTSRLSYTATTPEAAMAESLAHARYYNLPVSSALPKVLVALRLKANAVLDLTIKEHRKVLGMSRGVIAADWRLENQMRHQSLSQAWGAVFAQAGLEAVIVPSAASRQGINVLVFPENLRSGSTWRVLDSVKWR